MEKDVSKSHLSNGQSQTISPLDLCSGCGIERALESIVISVPEKKKKQTHSKHSIMRFFQAKQKKNNHLIFKMPKRLAITNRIVLNVVNCLCHWEDY